ncbi:MAG: ATP-binding cassette domain-containing protein [Bifidobacteriaceae bacterium]|nr:ATP-binding cassette domain-containing protein [Bifidobacteriaceae bacterium]
MSAPAAAVIATGLRKSFGQLEVLKGVDIQVEAGTVFALLGSNGAGKTTTVNILTTLLKPDAGQARVAGFDVVRQPRQVREAITVTGQNVTVDPILTGLENLALIATLRHIARPKRVAAELAERFGLAKASNKPAGTYSGGMKRRLDIAMSLIGQPEVIFLDEPTTGLDPAGRREVWAAIEQLAEAGATVVLTTQQMEEAAKLADGIVLLHDGVIAAKGTPDDILRAAGGAPDLETAFLALTADGGGRS